MASIDLAAVSKRREEIRDDVRRSSPALIYSGTDGIHIIAPHRSTVKHQHRVYRILDRIAFVPRGQAAACKQAAAHLFVKGEEFGMGTSRGYVFAEQLTTDLSPRIAHRWNHYWETPMPVEGVVVRLEASPDDDEILHLQVTGDFEPIERTCYLGGIGEGSIDLKVEEEQCDRLQDELQDAWEPEAGFVRILEIFRNLPTVREHESLQRAFDAPRVERVLLNRTNMAAKQWRSIFQRQS